MSITCSLCPLLFHYVHYLLTMSVVFSPCPLLAHSLLTIPGGPASVTIPQSTTFDTDNTGSKQLTLTCNANDVNPAGDLLTYSWTGRCQGNTESTCTFRPRIPGDDGMEVTCTVTNSYNNNQQRSHTYQLNLNCESSRLLRVT